MTNAPVKLGDLVIFRENNFPIQIEFESPDLIGDSPSVEVWANQIFLFSISPEINENVISFTTTVDQHRLLSRGDMYIKFDGIAEYWMPIRVTMDGLIAEPRILTISKPSIGTIRVSTYTDLAAVLQAEQYVLQTAANAQSAQTSANLAQQAANNASTGVIPKGPYNPVTNSPATTVTPNPAWADGSTLEISVAGTLAFGGINFSSGQAVNPRDILKKIGTQWFLSPFSIGSESIGQIEIKRQGVTVEKTDMFKPSTNLFNKTSAYNLVGYALSTTTGLPSASANFVSSHFMEVVAGQVYAIGPASGSTRKIWFDATGAFLSGISNSVSSITAPVGAAYLKISVDVTTAPLNTLMVVQASSLPSYQAFRLIMKNSAGADLYADKLSETTPLSSTNLGLVTSPNIFDYQSGDNLYGKIISAPSGVMVDDANFNSSHKIPCTVGQKVSVSIDGTYILVRKHFYNASDTYLNTDYNAAVSTAPTNCAYMRISVDLRIHEWEDVMVEIALTASAFRPFGQIQDEISGKKVYSRRAESALLAKKASALAEGAEIPVSTLGLGQSANLLDASSTDNQFGTYMSTSGSQSADADFNTTYRFPVVPGDKICVTIDKVPILIRKCYYNSSDVFISGNAVVEAPFTVPASAAYMRFSVQLSLYNWNRIMVEKSLTASDFEFFGLLQGQVADQDVSANNAKYALKAEKSDALQPTAVISGKNMGMIGGKNLYNVNYPGGTADDNLDTAYINHTNGALTTNSDYRTSHFMPVKAGQTLYLQTDTVDGGRINFYNAAKTWLSGFALTSGQTATAPVNTAYARASINATTQDFPTMMVAVATAHQTYEKYGWNFEQVDGVDVNPDVPDPEAPRIAPKIYIPGTKEIAVYAENVNLYHEQQGSRGRTNIKIPGGVQYNRSTRLTSGSSGVLSCSIDIADEQYKVRKTTPFQVQVVNSAITTAKKIYNIGDSYTLRSGFLNPILGGPVTGLTFIGMRKSTGADPTDVSPTPLNINHEGRGGWTFGNYSSLSTAIFNPFWQPQSPYKYYGNTSYWINAVGFPTDGAGHYDTFNVDSSILALYDGTTGLLLSPNVNDVMYNNSLAGYRRWDGSAWVTTPGLTWTFNFAKYRTLYGFAAPDIVHFLLGTNDFANTTFKRVEADYYTFKLRYDAAIASVKADTPAAKIIIGVPVPPGLIGEDGTFTTELRKAVFCRIAGFLYADYGGREAENIYIADYHSTTDRRYGYKRSQVLPFNQYNGSERESHLTDSVHLSADGFNQMGNIYMGIIQYLRL